MNKLYQYRKENGLCVMCGDRAVQGKTRCICCLQIAAVKQRLRYAGYSEEQKERNKEYYKQWQKNNPEKVAMYRSKKPEYNRRYFYGEEE